MKEYHGVGALTYATLRIARYEKVDQAETFYLHQFALGFESQRSRDSKGSSTIIKEIHCRGFKEWSMYLCEPMALYLHPRSSP